MTAKGTIKSDHIPVNNYSFIVPGLPLINFTEISGIEEELEKVELPDRTIASGGNTKPVEFKAKVPMHHFVEQAALEVWFKEGQDPVSPLYKKAGTLLHKSISGSKLRSYSVIGVFVTKRGLPNLEMKNEGDLALVEWTFSADDVLPV